MEGVEWIPIGNDDQGSHPAGQTRRGFGSARPKKERDETQEVITRLSNTVIRDLLPDTRFSGAVLFSLGNTMVGEVKEGPSIQQPGAFFFFPRGIFLSSFPFSGI